jgi:predicted MFS family arabinose efflux permease
VTATPIRHVAAAAPEVRNARRATAVVFAVHGCVTGSFAARIPWIAAHVGVGVGRLGLALLMLGVGALVAMPFSGRLAHRHDLRPLVTVTIVAWSAGLLLPALPSSFAVLCVVLLAFGAAAGLADMAMNAEGALVEKTFGRSVMSSFHGFWSVGVLVGSAVSALASHGGVDTRLQFAIEALVLASVGAAAARYLLDDPTSRATDPPPAFALPTRPVLMIGLVGLCCVFAEQAGTDWSAVYIREELGGSASAAAFAVSAFALTMATARLLGDRVIRKAGPVRTIQLSSVCAVAGAMAVILAPGVAFGLVGFAFLGVGVALTIPLVFAAAGRVGPHPARSIAGVAGVAYASGLVAPGVIGGVAAATSLTAAFGLVAVLVAIMGLAAGVVRRADPPGAERRAGPDAQATGHS